MNPQVSGDFLELKNGSAAPLDRVPEVAVQDLRKEILREVAAGKRIASFFGMSGPGDGVTLIAVLASDPESKLYVARGRVEGNAYEAITPDCPQAHWFEREIAEQMGIVPEGHPWLKPIRFHQSYREGHDAWGNTNSNTNSNTKNTKDPPVAGVTEFFRVEGEEVHEVAVGPVHAGVIEPGHFRFQCAGEHVFHLEISLGYQHRGIERALIGGPHKLTIHHMETAAGDTSVGHALAYCQAIEALSKTKPNARAHALRGIALELERLANHTGDLGALANDVAFLPTASYCGRIRGDFLNMTALLCGSRFGRGLIRPGGVGFDVDEGRAKELLERLGRAEKDVNGAVELLWETPSVQTRFEGTGVVSREACEAVGLVGVAARACGLQRDVRRDHPHGIFRFAYIPVMTAQMGDVFSRAYVRALEVQQSIEFIRQHIKALPRGEVRAPLKALAPSSIAVSLAEGWRGEICHVAVTDAEGRFARYKMTDPSFHNWFGLALALRDEQISDFPLCNKSFNLSYCGHDL